MRRQRHVAGNPGKQDSAIGGQRVQNQTGFYSGMKTLAGKHHAFFQGLLFDRLQRVAIFNCFCRPSLARAVRRFLLCFRTRQLAEGPLHIWANPIASEGVPIGNLLIVHDMSFVQRRSDDTKQYVLILFAGIALVVALITMLIAEVSWRGWVAGVKARRRDWWLSYL